MGCLFSNFRCCFTRRPSDQRFTDLAGYGYGEHNQRESKTYSWDSSDRPPACVIDGAENSEVIRESNGQQVIIRNCKSSKIYIVDWTTSAIIDDCQDCVLVVTVVGGSIFLRDTITTTLVSASTQLRLRDCSDIHLFSACESDPIIESCQKIVTAPFFITYSNIGEHFKSARLDNFVATHWGNIYDFTPGDPPNFTRLREPYDVKRFVPIPRSLIDSHQVTLSTRSFVPITQDEFRDKAVSLVLFPEPKRTEALDFVQNCKIAASSLLLTTVKDVDPEDGGTGKVVALLFSVPINALPVTEIEDVRVTDDPKRIRWYFMSLR